MSQFDFHYQKLCDDIEKSIVTKRRYLDDAKRNYVASLDPHRHLSRGAARYLYANNGYARANFARLVFEAFEELCLHNGVLHLTLTPRQGAMIERNAHLFNPAELKRLTTTWFGDVNMLGVIELGSFPNLKHELGKGWVCFHVHLIAWNISAVALRTKAKPFKEQYPAFVESRPSAFVQNVSANDIPALLRYQWKAPDIGYDLIAKREEREDRKTGELKTHFVSSRWTRKRSLRIGEMVRADNCLRELTFDKLLVGTGEGKGIARRICTKALSDQRDFERRFR